MLRQHPQHPALGWPTGFLTNARAMLSCKATSNADKFHQAVFSDFSVQLLPQAEISGATLLGRHERKDRCCYAKWISRLATGSARGGQSGSRPVAPRTHARR